MIGKTEDLASTDYRQRVERGFLASLAAEEWGEQFFVQVHLDRHPRSRRTVTTDGRTIVRTGERRRLKLGGMMYTPTPESWEVELDEPVDDEVIIPALRRPSPLLVQRLHRIAMASWDLGLLRVRASLMRTAKSGVVTANFADLSAHEWIALVRDADSW